MRFSEDRIEKLTCSDGIKRDIHIWEHEAPLAVFLAVHGLMDHGGNFMNPGIYLRAKGFTLVAHDQQGHDRKRKAHITRFDGFLDDLELMLLWTKEAYPEIPVFIVGHSMGGLIVTHFAIKRYQGDSRVKGFILSAPAYRNSVGTSKFKLAMARILSGLAPRMKVPLEDFRLHVTRDEAEYRRMREDEKDGIQATGMSARMGAEYIKAQDWIPEHMEEWNYPVLFIIPGTDRLISSDFTRDLRSKLDKKISTELYYPDNYHESFNELNREEVFAQMLEWCQSLI